ncbi:hypothetical protein [Aurantibacter sp.]|uniref:hypothetical protein n=1 Tax=Aurantibacter sp. TaxID=2807103 RepID=UPI003263FC91
MKTKFVVYISLFTLMLVSCTVEELNDSNEIPVVPESPEEEQQEELTLDKLTGSWIRIASNNIPNDGMIIEMKDAEGKITDKAGSSFNDGDIKWKDIEAIDAENYTYEELGSDYSYYNAFMELKGDDTLRISVGSSGAGNIQKWVHEGEYTPVSEQVSTETQKIDCDITVETTLTNGPAEIDYVVDCVIDVTAPLIVEAGVVIQFNENAGIGVYDDGSLTVNGSDTEPVVMQGEEATKGYWRGIHIQSNKLSNSLNYLQISDAGGNYVYCCNDASSIYLKDGMAAITNTEISNGKSYGIIATDNFEFNGYSENIITTHELAPLKLTMERIGEIDGVSSSYQGNDKNYIIIDDSGINEKITMKATDVPYRIELNKVIDVQARLDVEAGVEIVFEENAGLGVYDNGIINAIGTENEPIIFRGSEDISGFWRGIHTETNSSSNIIRYAEVKNAGSNYVYCCNDKAAIYIKSGQLTVEYSLIAQSGGCGINVNSNANFIELENEFNDNGTEGDVCN